MLQQSFRQTHQRVAVLIDDLHWSDGATLDLLHHLAHHTRDHPVLLLATYREAEARHSAPLEQTLLTLYREGLVDAIAVGPLERDAWLRCIRIAVDEENLDEPYRGQLWAYLEMAAHSMMNSFV